MKGALVILLFTAAVGLVLWLLDRRRRGEAADVVEPEQVCCGRHMVCEKTSLTPLDTKIEYFDDEELDRFAGRAAESYTPGEADEFREVMLTMAAREVPAWARSLQLRGIELPPGVRDELLLIVGELRETGG